MLEDKFSSAATKGLDPVSNALNEFFNDMDSDTEEPSAFIGLRLHLIRPDAAPEIDFYIKRGTTYRLFRDRKNDFFPFEEQSLINNGIERVYVRRKDAGEVKMYLETFLTIPPHNENIPMNAQVGLLRSSAITQTEDIFADPSPQNIRKGMKMVSNFVNVLLRDPAAFYHLINLSSHDPYTFQHSVGVGLVAIALGKKLNLHGESELMDLGIAGLLHDIGKTRVDPAIINKPGKLDEDEWAIMVQHSEWSYDIASQNPDLNERIRLAMRHHHEDLDGNGYPDGLIGNEISKFARVVAIADILNALTTDRTYSKAMSLYEALKLMQDRMSRKFDHDYFRSLVMIYGGDLK